MAHAAAAALDEHSSIADSPRQQRIPAEGLSVVIPGARSSSLAALIAAAPIVPIIAASVSLTTQLKPMHLATGWPDDVVHPLVVAMLIFAVAWMLASGVYWLLGLTAVDRANADSYGALVDRLRALTAQCETLKITRYADAECWCSGCRLRQAALQEATQHVSAISDYLRRAGPRWVLGVGYVALWKRILRADEALIQVQPLEALIVGAQYDALRCRGSAISYSEDLQAQVRGAATFLMRLPVSCCGMQAALSSSAPNGEAVKEVRSPEQPASGVWMAGSAANQRSEAAATVGPRSEAEARATLRRVRRSINQFRTDRWSGLVRARNPISVATTLMGLAVYAALWLAMMTIQDDVSQVIGAATAFFLVGAMIGLFNQCYSNARTLTAVDDYGLSLARLLVTPVVSGVAAVGGVVLLSLLSISQGSVNSIPPSVGGLGQFFTAGRLPFNIVVAATFGLTPGLLLDRLTQQSEQYKVEIRTSEAAESKKT